ncbi:hypothetical protein C818_01747 [Lachnospiraceae bacterium MD308]|nr:hypothetical protein C818_01747 [Lachnospiraceae bacterium MD308]
MNGTERIKALIENRPIDRTPIGGWYHMPLVDRNVGDYTRETIMSTDFNHWDFIKLMTNGHYYTAAYGGDIEFSTELTRWYGTIHKYPIVTEKDAEELPVLGAENPVFAREIEAVKILKDYYRDRIPILATIFNPLTAVQECAGSLNPEPVKRLMKEAPEALHKALEAMTQTNLNYLDELFEEGIDGIFLANQYSMKRIITEEQYEEFCVPYENRILEHCKGNTWFNMAHVHGNAGLRIERYYDCEQIQFLNWESCPGETPKEEIITIQKVKSETNQMIAAGIDQDRDFVSGTNDREEVKRRITERYQEAVRENGSNRFIFAPGCTLKPGGSYLNRLIYEVAEECGYSKTRG